jgi:hypothetical protein
MLSWGALRATLPVFTGGDAAVVRGVRADRGLRMGPMSPSRWMPRPPEYLILSMTRRGQTRIGE